ncbi:MAG: peptide ABC transporter permease [Planctomycetes bacterium RBG_16_43_13]|nr:MAG: peptide ABC transporter permease [Planctomycetes bacterium RBG_16_43_13]
MVTSFKDDDYVVFPLIPYSPLETDLISTDEKSTAKHILGTDGTGRDIMSRMIHGSRVSLSVGFVAVGISLTIGIILGALAGYYGGWVDNLIQRLIEIVICFPTFFLILTITAFLPQNIFNIMIAIGIVGWTGVARLVRGEFLKLRSQDFVTAARAIGTPASRIIFRHILPNGLAPVFVSATFGVAGAILVESSLSFLGFGVPVPTPSWGQILSDGRTNYEMFVTLYPGIAIFLTVTSYNLVGEALRDALDPRLKI